MSANALITKYRPETFKDVIGQNAVVKSLENAVKMKLGKVFLFTGPSGVGKTTLARITAKAFGCDPADIREEDAATNSSIEDIRKITGDLMYQPLGENGARGIIIDEIHGLSAKALDSLLKSLEDPPSWVYWMLCTTEPNKIPKALRTRALMFQLKEVRSRDLLDLLKDTDEGQDVDEDILELCVDEAMGSPRQALANLGVVMAAEDREEAAELLRSASEAPAAFELARALLNRALWPELRKILLGLKEKEVSPESVRHVVRAYMTTVILSDKTKNRHGAFDILRHFTTPFNSFDGVTPLAMACSRVVDDQERD